MKKILSFFKGNWFIFLILFVVLFNDFYHKRWDHKRIIEWDVVSYYAYLPALFYHNDLALNFFDEDPHYYAENHMYWPKKAPNGGNVIKTSMGMSILYSPFFGMAHLESKIQGTPTNGFTTTYHKWLQLSAVFYLFLGLFYLRKFIRKKFSNTASVITVLAIVLGTNLYWYSTFEGATSHCASFALISVFIYFFDKWYTKASVKSSIIIGISLGLIILIRPTNILITLFALFYNVNSFKSIASNLKLFFVNKVRYFALILLFAFLTVLPQLIYWKMVTGDFIFYSYMGESFYFLNPHIVEIFFSFRKGWLIYTPMMGLAILGFIVLYFRKRELFFASLITFLVVSYIISSWWCWWYGGSFSMRPFVDFYALMSIPFAALVHWIFNKHILARIAFSMVILALATLNIFQTYQYFKGTIHYDSMTKGAYKAGFGKLNSPESTWYYLRQPDYEGARLTGEEKN